MRRPSGETWTLPYETAGLWLTASPLGRRVKVSAGKKLYSQGETSLYFYFVISGQIQVSISRADGHEVILEIMGHGALCGEGAAFDGIPRFSSATVLRDAEVIEFHVKTLKEAFRKDPELAMSLLRITSLKQRVLAGRLQCAYSPNAEARIGEFLVRLSDNYSKPGASGSLIPVYLTHEQIASLTGTSRVTVTRTLTRWRKAGVIGVEGRHLRVLQPSKLIE